MASAGPFFPGTTAAVLETGDDDNWVTPGNAAADDGTETQVTAASFDANDQTGALRCSNFGFAIPADAVIDGIVVEVEQRRFAGAARDHQVQLFSSPGTGIGDNKATATAWPGTATIATYGGAADPWGASLTPAIVNASTFGVQVKAFATAANTDVGIDFVRMTVHYTPAASPGEASTITVGVALTTPGTKVGAGTAVVQTGTSLTTPGAKVAAAAGDLPVGVGMTTLGAKVSTAAPSLTVGTGLTSSGAKVGQSVSIITLGVSLTTSGAAGEPGEISAIALGVALTTTGTKVGRAISTVTLGLSSLAIGVKVGTSAPALDVAVSLSSSGMKHAAEVSVIALGVALTTTGGSAAPLDLPPMNIFTARYRARTVVARPKNRHEES